MKENFCAVDLFCLGATLFVCAACAAQERCSTEVKLLLSPAEIQNTVVTLQAQKESSGTIYFFDTEKRELLAEGVIIRLRLGSTRDLTVKLRSPYGRHFENPSNGRENFKCEVDLAANETNISYSIREGFAGLQIPAAGSDLYRTLSEGQRRLLNVAKVHIDWNQVKRVAEINVTDWQIKSGPRSKKLALELWEWPSGKILELSSRLENESDSQAYEELRKMALDKGLKLSVDQRSKTRILLEANATSVTN